MTQDRRNLKPIHGPSPEAAAVKNNIPCILIAKDDDEMRILLVQAVCSISYEAIQCRNGMDFIRHLESFILGKPIVDFELIISDILMPGLTGLEILEDLHDQKGFPPMILITAFGDKNTHDKAKQFGAAAIFDKPFEINDLLAKVQDIIPIHSL